MSNAVIISQIPCSWPDAYKEVNTLAKFLLIKYTRNGIKTLQPKHFNPEKVYCNKSHYICTRKGICMKKTLNPLQALVKQRRRKLKLTQQQLAAKSGVGLRFIRDLEQGKASLRMDKVNQVLLMFGHELGPVPIDRNTLINEKS